jgi:4-oxalocrotonate tautomerase
MRQVNVKLIEGVFTPEQKQRIVRDITDVMVAMPGENMRQVTYVVVEEAQSGDSGIAGSPLSTADVRARRHGRYQMAVRCSSSQGPGARRRGLALASCPAAGAACRLDRGRP